MGKNRPTLWVVAGPAVKPEEVADRLGDRFVIQTTDAASVRAALTRDGASLVLAEAGGFEAMQVWAGERQLGVLLASIGEGVCMTDEQGDVLWATDRFRAHDAQTRARIAAVCRRAAQSMSSGDGPRAAEGVHEVASADDSKVFEVVTGPVVMGDAEERQLAGPTGADTEHAQSVRENGQGVRAARIAAVVWDVTASKRIQRRMEAIDRAGRELVRLDGEQVRKMHVTDRLKLMQDRIVLFAHDLLHFDHFTIRLIDESTGKLELVMASGLSAESIEHEVRVGREGNGIIGYVAATGRSFLCADTSRERLYRAGLAGARSSLTVPLLLHDRVIGAFNVESEMAAAFTEEDRQFAEMFANHIALALHILDLLVVERAATGETVTGTVVGELDEPLKDIQGQAEELRGLEGVSAQVRARAEKVIADVESIRERLRDAAAGPRTILGAEKALHGMTIDPVIVGRRVLVADDEPRIRQIIRDVLGGRGADMVVCENGEQALRRLEPHERPFDLVISDIKMPDHNGYEIFSAARKRDATIPVILMTGFGYDPHHSIVRASQEGMQCVLFKPFQVERLLEEVRKALTQERAAAPG